MLTVVANYQPANASPIRST